MLKKQVCWIRLVFSTFIPRVTFWHLLTTFSRLCLLLHSCLWPCAYQDFSTHRIGGGESVVFWVTLYILQGKNYLLLSFVPSAPSMMPDTQEMLIKHPLSRVDSGKGGWKGESLTSEIFKYSLWNFEQIIQGGPGQVKLLIKHSLNTVWLASFLTVAFVYFQELRIPSEHHEFKPFWNRLWINQGNEWLVS